MAKTSGVNEKILLHVCCAPCSPHVVGQLAERYDVTLYFYNPNIHPEREYNRRLDELRKWAGDEKLDLIEEDYDSDLWLEKTAGLESVPERGERCDSCFELRLARTAAKAVELGYENYGTILTVSPHKNAAVINKIGANNGEIFGVKFEEADWKKKDGFKKSVAFAKVKEFYRQDYCGCLYSLEAKNQREASRKQ